MVELYAFVCNCFLLFKTLKKDLTSNEISNFVAEAEMLIRSGATPTKLSANQKRAQALLKRLKDTTNQRESTLKKLAKDWRTYEDKKTLILSAVEASKSIQEENEEPAVKVSTEKRLESMTVRALYLQKFS